ncbi:acyl-CoA dehydrogenase family protein [Gordonia terrae]
MFDERWPQECDELAEALGAVLDKYCTADDLRDAQNQDGEDFGRPPRLGAALDDFGLAELPSDDPLLLTRAAAELGRRLAPVDFVSVTPVTVAAGLAGVANGVDRSVVPAGVSRAVVVGADGELAIVELDGATPRRSSGGEPVKLVAGAPVSDETITARADDLRSWGLLLEAARLTGAAEALLRYGVKYVGERHQFGRPVGSFQGVAFPLADAATAVSAADLLVRHAAYLAAEDGAPSLVHAAMAAAKARQAGRRTASTVHQALGGHGFTIEADCQLYSRRIRAWTGEMPDTSPILTDMARRLVDPERRAEITDLWNHDSGFTLPHWAGPEPR